MAKKRKPKVYVVRAFKNAEGKLGLDPACTLDDVAAVATALGARFEFRVTPKGVRND